MIDVAKVLGEIRRENLHGRLYVHPRTRARREAVQILADAGFVERIPGTCTCLGGWWIVLDPEYD